MDTKNKRAIIGGFFVTIAAFCAVGYFGWTVVPYLQGREYLTVAGAISKPADILDDKLIFRPYTSAQGTIRQLFLVATLDRYYNGLVKGPDALLDGSVARLEEYATRFPYYYDFFLLLGKAYGIQAELKKDPSLYKTGEEYLKKALAVGPGRQDVIYSYAINLLNQGRSDEALALLRETIKRTPELPDTHYQLGQALAVFGPSRYDESMAEFEFALSRGVNHSPAVTVNIYQKFFYHYYQIRDPKHFAVAARRLAELDPAQGEAFLRVAEYAETRNAIPSIDIQQGDS